MNQTEIRKFCDLNALTHHEKIQLAKISNGQRDFNSSYHWRESQKQVYESLKQKGWLSPKGSLNSEAREYLSQYHQSQRAIILAAGKGQRSLPLMEQYPKALLEVENIPLIERLIEQLQEAGIKEIYIVTGFMADKFQYLKEKYDVCLLHNKDYVNESSLKTLSYCPNFENCYIVSSCLYFDQNPFHAIEPESWYLMSSASTACAAGFVDENLQIHLQDEGMTLTGLAYIDKNDASLVEDLIHQSIQNKENLSKRWEYALSKEGKLLLSARIVSEDEVYIIETFEQLRNIDANSNSLLVQSIELLMEVFQCSLHQLKNISVLKKGMTNRSYLVEFDKKKYIVRVPGEGTQQLISRKKEKEVYDLLSEKQVSDEIIYLNPENGYKVSCFLENSRCVDALNHEDVELAMSCLRRFHTLGLKANHDFDLFKQREFYESLRQGVSSVYEDYDEVKSRCQELKNYLDTFSPEWTLCHIDAVPDNFLLYSNPVDGTQEIRMIDWEYAGNQDPLVDLAMFIVYASYDEENMLSLLETYFQRRPTDLEIARLFGYVAVCGLLWSDWCEYKALKGVEFKDYPLVQYNYAKVYSAKALDKFKLLTQEK